MCVLDLGDMQMAYVFAETPTAVNLAIAQNAGVFPHPSGVDATVRTALLWQAQLVAGTSGDDVGFSESGAWGSLTPDTDINGNTIANIYYNSASDTLNIAINGTSLISSYFNDLTINGVSFAASAATFTGGGLQSTWGWSGVSASPFVSGDTYTILLS